MSTVRMRPTFLVETDLAEKEVINRIQKIVSERPDFKTFAGEQKRNYHGQFVGNHATISIDQSSRHFWSPWMYVEVREIEGVRQIFGRFSPNPSIWTAVMLSYLAIGVLVFFATMFGISQQLSRQSPWAYYLIPVGLLAAGVLWSISKMGQNLAHSEMKQMKMTLEECVNADQ